MTANMAFDIFVNYRRQDSRADAGRLYDRLGAHFGQKHVFMDVDDITPGQNFVHILDQTLDSCSILIVLIGNHWIDARDEDGKRRLNQADDYVRMEIQRAIERGITVIPVLVGRASMPDIDDLPPEIALLSQHQAVEISDKRFHQDVDRLIAEMESINGAKQHSKKITLPLKWRQSVLLLLSIAVALYFSTDRYLTYQSNQNQLQAHLDVGDRLAEKHDYGAAVKAYEKALTIAPDSIDAYRKSISAYREMLLSHAFLGDSSLDIGLRHDYINRYSPVKPTEISKALNLVYSVQALKPALKQDVNLLLDEALILKTSGLRVKEAIQILEKANKLAPGNAAVLAEYGLLRAVLLNDQEGLESINLAADAEPNKSRYHFYLARALDEVYKCSYSKPDYTGSGADQGCASALMAYRHAAELAVDEGQWSRHIYRSAIYSSLNIFHRYSRKQQNVLTPHLAMSLDERIRQLEFLIPREHKRSRNGWVDYPCYWLALLYGGKNDLQKASLLMHQLLEEHNYRPEIWLKYQAKLLKSSGHAPKQLKKIRSLLAEIKK